MMYVVIRRPIIEQGTDILTVILNIHLGVLVFILCHHSSGSVSSILMFQQFNIFGIIARADSTK